MPELLAELFSSRVRSAVLGLILPRSHLAFSLTAMSRRLGLPVSSLQHECYKLARLGLLRDERRGNTRLYRPNPVWPLLTPLTGLVVGALPLESALTAAIEEVSGLQEVWAAGDRSSPSATVYLVAVGAIDVETLDGVFDRARVALVPAAASGRVELAYFRPSDWSRRLASGDAFAASLLAGERVLPDGMGQDASANRLTAAGAPAQGTRRRAGHGG